MSHFSEFCGKKKRSAGGTLASTSTNTLHTLLASNQQPRYVTRPRRERKEKRIKAEAGSQPWRLQMCGLLSLLAWLLLLRGQSRG